MLVAGCEVSNSRLDDARQWIDDQFFLFQEPGTAQISLDAHFPRARQAAFGGCVPNSGRALSLDAALFCWRLGLTAPATSWACILRTA